MANLTQQDIDEIAIAFELNGAKNNVEIREALEKVLLDITEQETSVNLGINNVTGNPGGGEPNAVALTSSVNVVTIATFGDSVKLTDSLALGAQVVIHNNTDIDGVSIFPASGGSINGGTDSEWNLSPRETAFAYKIAANTFIVSNVTEV